MIDQGWFTAIFDALKPNFSMNQKEWFANYFSLANDNLIRFKLNDLKPLSNFVDQITDWLHLCGVQLINVSEVY